MHIPDKYRDRYDALAEEHPWMLEMRDETETIGDLIEKRKEEIEERNFLIAKARNSFKSLAESNYDYAKFRKACRRATEIMDAEMDRMGIASDGRALEASEEPTNGDGGETNGIADEITLSDENAVAVMRKAANGYEGGTGYVLKNAKPLLGMDEKSTDTDLLETLADMVERDYVRRDGYDFVVDALKYMKAERDELDTFAKRLERAAHDKLSVTLFGVDYVTEEFMLRVRDTLTAERDEQIAELQGQVDSLTEQKDTLISYVEADGTRYSEDDGSQVFDHSNLASGDYHEEWHRVCVERDDLARTLGETMAERELYRDLCSQMLDAMDDIRAKVDASFPRGGSEVM